MELNDGLFEVTLVKKPANLLEMNNIIKALVDKRVHSDAFRLTQAVHLMSDVIIQHSPKKENLSNRIFWKLLRDSDFQRPVLILNDGPVMIAPELSVQCPRHLLIGFYRDPGSLKTPNRWTA